ncbi:hypothetical protein D3C76_1755380 [compost metagenome]
MVLAKSGLANTSARTLVPLTNTSTVAPGSSAPSSALAAKNWMGCILSLYQVLKVIAGAKLSWERVLLQVS